MSTNATARPVSIRTPMDPSTSVEEDCTENGNTEYVESAIRRIRFYR